MPCHYSLLILTMAFLQYLSWKWKLLLFSSFFIPCSRNRAVGAPQVPCYFIFGDSLSDAGNNNNLLTLAKSNFLPYGIDFPNGPTGRFTNGPTIVDYIALLLGFDSYIQNFTVAVENNSNNLTRGVNYASGAAGIRDETGMQMGERISLNHQLLRHGVIVAKIKAMLTHQDAESLLNQCIYTVEMGNNDYINNYFMPQIYPTSKIYTPQQFAEELASQYAQQLRVLYVLGARKVAILGPGLIGCTPQEVSTHGATNGSTCNQNLNGAVILFNEQLRPLVSSLNSEFHDAIFTLIDMISIANSSAASLALLNTTAPCCEIDPVLGTCKPNGQVCAVRDSYAYLDGFHPTRIINQGLAGRSYQKEQQSDADPYDIHQLVNM